MPHKKQFSIILEFYLLQIHLSPFHPSHQFLLFSINRKIRILSSMSPFFFSISVLLFMQSLTYRHLDQAPGMTMLPSRSHLPAEETYMNRELSYEHFQCTVQYIRESYEPKHAVVTFLCLLELQKLYQNTQKLQKTFYQIMHP